MVDTPKNMEEALATIKYLTDEISEAITCRQKFESQKEEANKRAEAAEEQYIQLKEARQENGSLDERRCKEYEARFDSLVNEKKQLQAQFENEKNLRVSAEGSYNALVSFRAIQSTATPTNQQPIDLEAIAQPVVNQYIAQANQLLEGLTKENDQMKKNAIQNHERIVSEKNAEIDRLRTMLQVAATENIEWRRRAGCVQGSVGLQALGIEQHVPISQYLRDMGAKDSQISSMENELGAVAREKKEWKTKAENLQADWYILHTKLMDKNSEWEYQCELAKQKQKDFKNEQWLRMDIERENNRLHREIADLNTQKKQNQSSESHHNIENQPRDGPVISTDEETPFQQGIRLRASNEKIKALQATIASKDKKISNLEAMQHGWEFGKKELVRQKNELRERLDEVLKSPTIPSNKPTAPGFFTTMFMCVGMGLLSMAGERGYFVVMGAGGWWS